MSSSIFSFLLTCLVVELTPGPNMTYLAMISATRGRKAGFAMVAGIASGLLVVGVAAALGAATLVAESRALYHALRWAGALYMVWLAYECWRGEEKTAGAHAHEAAQYFYRGLVTNLLNPKAAVFYITVFPAFIDDARPALPQLLALTFVYVCVATAMHGLIAVLGDAMRPLLRDTRGLRALFSGLLLCVAAWILWVTR
jgi:threonine/homoserine/homoserine lactone efflux protein